MSPDPRRQLTMVLSGLMFVLGIAIIVRTVVAGGGALAIGIVMGVLFVLAGAGRFWVARRRI